MSSTNFFVVFSEPFVNSIKKTCDVMLGTDAKIHSPRIKEDNTVIGEITATIGMNGVYEKDNVKKDFKGMMALSWSLETYLNISSKLLMEEFKEFCDDNADTGAEIVNIVMGDAKSSLVNLGYKIEMATPTTIVGKGHKLMHPSGTKAIQSTITTDLGDFWFEICYQESSI